MLRTKCKAAPFLLMLSLLLGRLGAVPSAPHVCLGRKDAKRVEKAKEPEKRLLVYVRTTQRIAGTIWYCLSGAGAWREVGTLECQDFEDMLALLDCAEQGITEELAAWRPSRGKSDAALRSAQKNLWPAKRDLRFAEDDAQRPTLGLGPSVPNQIKARRQALEDIELTIARLLGERRPTGSTLDKQD